MADNETSQTAPAGTTTGSADPAPVAPVTPVVENPSVAPAATPSAAPAEAAPAAAPDAATSVMGDSGDAKPEGKADATKAETSVDSKDGAKTETPPETKPEIVLPTYADYKFPDGFTVEKDSLGAFNKLLGEIETGKVDHASMQEKGQALIELGVKSVNESITKLNDYYVQIHEKQKNDWFDAFKGDPEIGGDKVPETVKSVRDAIDNFGGTKEQITELRTQMKESGYGNYPALIRLINNMQSKINSYTKETKSPVVPGAKPAPVAVKNYQQFYSKAGA